MYEQDEDKKINLINTKTIILDLAIFILFIIDAL